MKKKRILIASIIFILIICIVTAVFIIKNRNRSTSNTMYTYGSGDVRCNYSEDNVLYLDDSAEYCISSIRHQARTWSIAISPTAHMKDSRAPMRSPHVLQLFMV